MSDLPTPEPEVTPETEPFWEATAEGRLLLKECGDCGRVHYYPRARCPHCGSAATDWTEATGRGTVYSFSVLRQAGGDYGEATPYVLAYVELEEGPRMLTNVVDCDPETVEVGMPVEVTFDAAGEDAALPRFRPR